MPTSRNQRLRVGIIGLGRLWEARHKPAFARLADRFRVTAVYDHVARRAAVEARNLDCDAPEGIHALVDRPDVDVVYLLNPQWFGLYPIEVACRARKPVYCAVPVAGALAELEALAGPVHDAGVPVMFELARRFYPVTLRLRELLATTLGPPRMILGQSRLYGYDRYGQPGPSTQITPAPLLIDPGSYLLDWCRFLFDGEPVSVDRTSGEVLPALSPPDADFESFSARFGSGQLAQIAFYRYHRDAWGESTRFLPQPGFQVFAERGAAWLEMPDRIVWSDSGGTHEERLPLEPSVGEILNDQFHRKVRGDQSLATTFDDALGLARLVRGLETQ